MTCPSQGQMSRASPSGVMGVIVPFFHVTHRQSWPRLSHAQARQRLSALGAHDGKPQDRIVPA